jgi:hypothetical protein
MLVARERVQCAVHFQDRDGNRRVTTFWFPFAISAGDLETAMGIIMARIVPLTDAYMPKWDATYIWDDDGESTAAEGSDVIAKAALFYRNGPAGAFEALYVPAPRSLLFETTGDLAGIRINATDSTVADLLDGLQDIVTFIVTPEGDEFPTGYVVGGLAL